jgi:multisubunit Na+/H+ antiporter MnhG subunit
MTTARDCEIGFDLAHALKLDLLERVPQPDTAAILHACCWLLADVITQAATQDRISVEQGIAVVMFQLTDAVGRLTLANAEADAAEVTH